MFQKVFLAIYIFLAVMSLYGLFSGSTTFFNLLLLVGLGLVYIMLQRSALAISILDILTRPKGHVELPDYLGRGHGAELSAFKAQIEKVKNLQIIERLEAVLKPITKKSFAWVKQFILSKVNLIWLKYSAIGFAALFIGYLGISKINQMSSIFMALVVADETILSYVRGWAVFKDIKPYIIPLSALISVVFLYFGLRLKLIIVRLVSLVFLAASIVGLFVVTPDGFFMKQIFDYQISWIMMPVGLLTLLAAVLYAKFMNVTRKVERKLFIPSGLAWAGVLLFLPLGALELADHSTVYPILVFISIYVFISDLLGRYLGFMTLRLPILGLIVPLSLSVAFHFMSAVHGDYSLWELPAIGAAFVVQYYMLFTRPAYLMRFIHMLTALLLLVFLVIIQEKYVNSTTIINAIAFASLPLLFYGLLHNVFKKFMRRFIVVYDRYVMPSYLFVLFAVTYIIIPTSAKVEWAYLTVVLAMVLFSIMANVPLQLRKMMVILTGATLMLWLTVAIVIWLQAGHYVGSTFIQGLMNPKILVWVAPAWALFFVGSVIILKLSSRRQGPDKQSFN